MMESSKQFLSIDAPTGWADIVVRALKTAVVAFVVLQAKEWFDAGRFDTPATAVDAVLVAAAVALEFEAAVISAELRRSPADTSAMPARVEESGLGDVEGQIRWRFQRETENRPEFFTFFETVFPLQRSRKLIGTQDWEFSFGLGLTRGFRWGTVTARAAGEYSRETRQFDTGEYAVEYLRRLSPAWRVVAAIEGNQVDEVSLLTEVQWQFVPHAALKLNGGWGLTTNATDFAPEVGIMFSF